MHTRSGLIRYSPADLLEFLASPFATWMSRFALDHPALAQPDPDPPELTVLAERGRQHEQACLEQFRRAGRDIYVPPEGAVRTGATVAAMRSGREVIYQGRLAHDAVHGSFIGQPDFLVRTDGTSDLGEYHYEVWDAKLAHHPSPVFLIQLCCYVDLLTVVQARHPEHVCLLVGSGEQPRFRTADYIYYYGALKQGFLEFLQHFDPEQQPAPELGGSYGRWSSAAARLLDAADHLSRVAKITVGQIQKLNAAGITTLQALAESSLAHVPKLDDAVLARLKEQAYLQLVSTDTERPTYRILIPESSQPVRGLGLLPSASPGDVFFDMEGYPLVEGGLEYLFGAVSIHNDAVMFNDWWAHNADEERRAFSDFVDWVYARWRVDPSMHIYHYANYEIAALRRLMGRYGSREVEVDMLLRREVFVDLYTIVQQGLRVGEPHYSIKNLEHLYRPRRSGDVTSAIDSIVGYARWLESGEPGDWSVSPLLQAIRVYNRDDCESTWQLATWLRERQREAGIVWSPKHESQDEDEVEGVTEGADEADLLGDPASPHALARTLIEEIPPILERATHAEHWHIQELLGHMLEFHRREEKPGWWAMFDRHAMTEAELVEDVNCLGGMARLSQPSEQIKRSQGFWYGFEPDQDTKLDVDGQCYFAHDLDMKVPIHALDRERGRICLKFGPSKLKQFPHGTPPERLSLIPDEHVSAKVIEGAVLKVTLAWQEKYVLSPALKDFVLRCPPRLSQDGLLSGLSSSDQVRNELVAPDEDPGDAAARLVLSLDHSTLCVQGPPGSGKTTTAARMILALLDHGKRVGITANSHAAILNLMRKCKELRAGRLACLKIGGSEEDGFFELCPEALYVERVRDALPRLDQVQLVGGTAWAFSDPGMRASLEYLFVDEAGQVSVANLIGMAAATDNIILVGDQMQLGQPIQGSHPGESGLSILEYLLEGRATIPADMGLFLGTTWRLHPSVCHFLSDAVYEGRLQAAAQTAERRVLLPNTGGTGGEYVTQEAGLLFVPVTHVGNIQGSGEEVGLICELVDELLGRELTDTQGQLCGQLQLSDILFVAPYNMQVRKLQTALGPHARVGSVDKFQGQEAPVVILSMCASQGEGSPRDIDFLFNKNRLNVALSRAQSLAIVVANPALARTQCLSLAQMEQVNLFCRVMDEGRRL